MKAKCIKTDPLGMLTVGQVYEYTVKNNVYLINRRMGMSMARFKEHFKELQ